MAANAVPEAQCLPDLLKKLDNEDPDRPEPVKLSTQQRQDLLLATLQKDGGLDCLKEWLPDLAQKAVALLLEFHHIFSLKPNRMHRHHGACHRAHEGRAIQGEVLAHRPSPGG